MTLNTLLSRVREGEVVPCGQINGKFPDEYIQKNPSLFDGLVVENAMDEMDVCWIYSPEIRSQQEYNP